MSLEDNIEDLIHDVKVRKEAWVKEHVDTTDMPTLVCAYRDGELVAQAFALPDRDKMLDCVQVMCFGLMAYEITAAFETYHTSLPKNPITEEEWGPGEMAFIAEEHDGIKKGWVTEATSLSAYSRDGAWFMATLPFSTKEGEVTWGEPVIMRSDQMTEKQQVGGLVHERILASITGETMEDKAKADLGEEGYELLTQNLGVDRLVHSDIATIKWLLKQGLAVAAGLVAAPDSERAERVDVLMKRSIERDQGFNILYDSSEVNN
jgi:hypothetical protein